MKYFPVQTIDPEILAEIGMSIRAMLEHARPAMHIYRQMREQFPNYPNWVFRTMVRSLENTGSIKRVYGNTTAAMYILTDLGRKELELWKSKLSDR